VTTDDGWLLVSASTAGAAATLRVTVWRRLRSLGALYIQQSVCLLPERPEVVREVRRLVDRVHHQGGSARVLRIELTDPVERAQVVAELNAARDAEYAEVLDRIPAFRQELEMERARGRASYVEVEESEADLERFRSWLAKIAQRDYFDASGGAAAREAVAAAAAKLEAFEAEALRIEAPVEPASPTTKAGLAERAGKKLRVADEL
jgi:hypothetical protein